MVVKLTQEQANFLETFGNLEDEMNQKRALCHITKMVEAVINGYEVIFEPKFKFYNFSDRSGSTPLYYAGKASELKGNKKFALEVKKDSEEYKALLTLGFVIEEV
ncbi:hypothetical protein HYQ13_gp41 [Lactococcus phage CHPC52]|uniref:Uncharacterized protein n=1 Tax=Lactococcus phage CHPC52 TaxID=2675251 RepID=A0A650ESN4_9CAUD|nr:hypothetical protein HYQ13_gp41 [Lactococcus phage CHPC52]QGT53050.1 hypothetical protein CHPC52_000707 [Lactococcus phage CHPC52]